MGVFFCWIFVLRVLKSTPNKVEPPKALVVVALDLLVGLGVVEGERILLRQGGLPGTGDDWVAVKLLYWGNPINYYIHPLW